MAREDSQLSIELAARKDLQLSIELVSKKVSQLCCISCSEKTCNKIINKVKFFSYRWVLAQKSLREQNHSTHIDECWLKNHQENYNHSTHTDECWPKKSLQEYNYLTHRNECFHEKLILLWWKFSLPTYTKGIVIRRIYCQSKHKLSD